MKNKTVSIDGIILEANGQGRLMRHKLHADKAGQCIYLRGGLRGYLKFELWSQYNKVVAPTSFLAIAEWIEGNWQRLQSVEDSDASCWLAEARQVLGEEFIKIDEEKEQQNDTSKK